MKPALVVLILAALAIPLVVMGFQSSEKVQYNVSDCYEFLGEYRNYYEYDSKNRTLKAFVTVNCGSDEILVEKRGEKIAILEKDYDGKLARCLCQKEVRIFGLDELKVEFVDWSGNSTVLVKDSGFCGRSTFAYCERDEDCKIGGCSAQICMGAKEEIFTTCEYRECYDYLKYGVACKCVRNMCQWI
uniref:Eight-cysteine-cluster domain-containing protein n=1 Tax=Archaeoglobus fulgidus TaxID=2234 RepID=A0A7J2TKJ2_ARCFL